LVAEIFSYFFDLIMFSLALGVTYFVYYLCKAFKGGVMGLPFKVLTVSIGLLTVSQALSLVGFFSQIQDLQIIQEGIEIGFLLFALLGFYKLYAFWRFDFIGQIQNTVSRAETPEITQSTDQGNF
jgi:hypothetical protein